MDPASPSRTKPKLHRSHTALPKFTASPDSSNKRHHHHLPRPHHKHHHHGHSARETIQSAIQLHPPTSFGDLLKQTSRSGVTSQPEVEPDGRHESGADVDTNTGNELREVMTSGTASITGAAAVLLDGLVRPEDVERERARAKKRQECESAISSHFSFSPLPLSLLFSCRSILLHTLSCFPASLPTLRIHLTSALPHREIRTTLSSLLQTSLRSTRRLDDTYYSILEHLAALRASIASLHELSGLARALHAGFRADADDLRADAHAQIDAFDGFEQQARRVHALEDRVRRSKEKASGLDRRLEDARRRVLERERVEAEKQDTARRRARIFSIGVAVVAVVLALLVVASHFRDEVPVGGGVGEELGALGSVLGSGNASAKIEAAPVPVDVKSILSSVKTTKSKRKTAPTSKPTLGVGADDDDPLLRIFDEL
jgi:hypothetical protein